jgi:sulfatase maturation enzyme AslB (radical SAM superfamily)
MSFEKTFCPSPWFHMHINNQGHYGYCRWATKDDQLENPSIGEISPIEFFQKNMIEVRKTLLEGRTVDACNRCYLMEKHQKVSGRQRQLLKIGVTVDNFDKTMLSSPWLDHCRSEHTSLLPQDWQIDLGNYCNSACVFCSPRYSSRLAHEFKKLDIISSLPPDNWCNDAAQVERFVNTLKNSPKLKYLHFLGGETLITPAFKTILQTLIENNLHQTVSIGFTTNLTTWDNEIAHMLTKFHNVNLGLSIECFDQVNDYVRWPSNIDTVKRLIESWLNLATKYQWLVQFRTTPTLLTVSRLLSVYEYAWDKNISVESCNFLEKPEFLRISVLPRNYRQSVIDNIKDWLTSRSNYQHQVVNTRHPDFAKIQLVQDLNSYVRYLETEIDESHRLSECVNYLKLLESNRKNSILDYLPEYEQLFRSAGY